ncbi:NUDIX domain-containing protein [Actinocorallia aurea]
MAGVDYVGFGVGGMVFDGDGRVFLAKRGAGARNEAGTWEFPGGGLEFGERMGDAVVREFAEEYGMRVETTGLLGVFDHILPEEGQHWVSATFLGIHTGGVPEIREPEKCTEIGWFALDALPEPLSRITRENVVAYRAAR